NSRWLVCKRRCARSSKSRGLIRYFRFSRMWMPR
ncbi:MAG: hypothetical protein DME87_05715, partial [Verrucomicrobia bacterium]